jgi:phosphatidylinositol alpha-1,6-mannosyltransferase
MYWQINFGKEQFLIIKRDLLITHEFAPFHGGVATYCTEVARAASQSGRKLVVWAPGSPDPADPAEVLRLGGEVSLLLPNLIHLARQIYKRKSLWSGQRIYLASLGAHWIFAHFWRFGLMGDARVIPIFHGSEILRYERNPWWRSFIKSWLNSCERVVAASAFTQKRLQESFLLPQGKLVELAPCAVRTDLLGGVSLRPMETGHSKPFTILTLARLHPRKGQADVIRALGQLPEGLRGQVIYQLAGTGEEEYRRELEILAQSRGVAVTFLGEVADEHLAEVYAGCDLYVMSSRILSRSVEGFGMTYLEAGIFAKPVVGYRTGGVEGAVLHEQTGLLVEEGDVAALSGAIQRLLENRDLQQKFGQQGRVHALSFSWKKTVDILLGTP